MNGEPAIDAHCWDNDDSEERSAAALSAALCAWEKLTERVLVELRAFYPTYTHADLAAYIADAALADAQHLLHAGLPDREDDSV